MQPKEQTRPWKKFIAMPVALMAAGALFAGCGSSAGSPAKAAQPSVKSDLAALIKDNPGKFRFAGNGFDQPNVTFCTHQSGNLYICQIQSPDGKNYDANITDDGNSIYSDGFSPEG